MEEQASCHLSDLVHSTTIIQNVNKAQVKVRAKKDNVAGKFKNDNDLKKRKKVLS